MTKTDLAQQFAYKATVQAIKDLPWEHLDEKKLSSLLLMAEASAYEFGEALRIAIRLYPDDPLLQEMAAGEINTDNLQREDYTGPGDHAHFLSHFVKKYGVTPSAAVSAAIETYRAYCKTLPDTVRAMTIFSREEELAGIFERILHSPYWNTQPLKAFQYYLQQHIALDSGPGGHHDLTKNHPVDDDVAGFYNRRLELYEPLFAN